MCLMQWNIQVYVAYTTLQLKYNGIKSCAFHVFMCLVEAIARLRLNYASFMRKYIG